MTREDAIDVLKHNYPSACFTDLCDAVEIAIQALSAQPEIIRCKDCKWWVPERCAGEPKVGRCKDKCASERSDGFCSHGERKTAESE